jgi:hypothetical protein
MPVFTPNQAIETEVPTITVDIDPQNPLGVGQHLFQLVVTDDAGNRSSPATVAILVRDLELPTAVIDGPRGGVGFNQPFQLSGERSSDPAPGRIVRFEWTLLDR